MMRRICEITVTLDFIFRLVLCRREDVSFNIVCLNVLEGIKPYYLLRAILCNHLYFYKGSRHAHSRILLKLSYHGHGDTKPSNQHSFHPDACPLPWKRLMNILAEKVTKTLKIEGFPN